MTISFLNLIYIISLIEIFSHIFSHSKFYFGKARDNFGILEYSHCFYSEMGKEPLVVKENIKLKDCNDVEARSTKVICHISVNFGFRLSLSLLKMYLLMKVKIQILGLLVVTFVTSGFSYPCCLFFVTRPTLPLIFQCKFHTNSS